MKCLIIDRPGFQLQTRKMLLEEAVDHKTFDTVTTLGELYLKFQKGIYDIVIVDNTIDHGQEYVDYILRTDPRQQMLVVSNAISCVVQRCEDCVSNHQIRSLNNPTPIKNIIRMVEGFKLHRCDHYDAQTNKLP